MKDCLPPYLRLRAHLSTFILVASAAASGSAIFAPAAIASTRFDDWELVCPAEGEAAASAATEAEGACRLQQAQAVNEGKDVVFLFNVVMQENKPIAIISTPLNVYLPAGLELRIDGGGARRAAFETCNISGCHAGFALEGPLLAGLRRGNVLSVTMKDSKASQVPVEVSLKGITAGLEALAEQN
ncbi:invasion associated locus B family protein [Chelativorans xinjiangense]|uniref:invasion associated locus B family protein n=1 Tax=Chelativorans xinjiangense TaxID=2681485 RepID=UPI001356ED47|nr:invasion associated locus B family protein [Chelativorans xinjiangense]